MKSGCRAVQSIGGRQILPSRTLIFAAHKFGILELALTKILQAKKPSALLLAGVDPKKTMLICQKAACRMVIPNTSIHAWVIQSKSKKKSGVKAAASGSEASGSGRGASSSSASTQRGPAKGKGPAAGLREMQTEDSHPAQRRVPQVVNSRVPLELWDHVWTAHLSWLATVDG